MLRAHYADQCILIDQLRIDIRRRLVDAAGPQIDAAVHQPLKGAMVPVDQPDADTRRLMVDALESCREDELCHVIGNGESQGALATGRVKIFGLQKILGVIESQA